jgi:hypothetical protein
VDTQIAELESTSARPGQSSGRVAGIIVVAVVVALAAVLAATGGKPLPTATVFAHAVSQTTGSGTAHASVVATVSFGGRSLKIADITSDSDFHTRANATVKTSVLQEQIRSVQGVTYLSIPGVALPRGAHWLSITAADVKADPNASSTVGSRDPSTGLQFLSAVDGNPQVAGDTTLDGARVTHYLFTLNLRAYFDRVGNEAKALNSSSLAQSLESLGKIVDLSAVPGEAWLDGQGRVRRFSFSITATQNGDKVTATDDFRFSRFGEPVVVTAPAASDTVPFRENRDYFSKVAAAARARATTG